MSDNWNKDLPSEGMKAKVNRKCRVSFFAWTAETPSTIKVIFTSYFASNPESESESEPESESIRSPEPEPESEQPHHDSAPLVSALSTGALRSNPLRRCFQFSVPVSQCHLSDSGPLLSIWLSAVACCWLALPGRSVFIIYGRLRGTQRGRARLLRTDVPIGCRLPSPRTAALRYLLRLTPCKVAHLAAHCEKDDSSFM